MSVTAPPAVAVDTHEGLPSPRRLLAFLTVALGIVMAVLDGTIVNVALPTIGGDLQATAAESIWIVTAYQLTVAMALFPLATLARPLASAGFSPSGWWCFPPHRCSAPTPTACCC